MSTDDPEQIKREKEEQARIKDAQARDEMRAKLREKGAQRLSLKEYQLLRNKGLRGKFRIPQHLKIVLITPMIILFCFGVFYLPYLIYLIATGKKAPENAKKENNPTSVIYKSDPSTQP